MKKYLPYIIIILLLGGAAAWYFVSQSPEAVKEREGDFAVKDKAAITRIVIDHGEVKRHAELTLRDGLWVINGKYPARDDLMKSLMEIITRVTSLAPVARAAHDNVVRELNEKRLKIQIYSGDKLLKSYWVGGATVDGKGTYMLLDMGDKTAGRPHITYVPGGRGYLTHYFETDEKIWRTRIVFNYLPEEIQKLKVEYPGDEKNSFTITQVTKDSFAVEPLNAKYMINETYQQKYVKQYLDFYKFINVEAFENTNTIKDTILQTTPYCILTVTENDSSVNNVKVYYMPINKRSKARYDVYGRAITHDVDRYYATIHNGDDFVLIQQFVFGDLFRNYKDFFFKPGSEGKESASGK